jgi:hypothetical protein
LHLQAVERIEWKLITDLTVPNREEAIEKLRWYGLRWKIETFHKILKSGCKAEQARLRAAERIVNLLAILCLLSWRIFWMTMLNSTTASIIRSSNADKQPAAMWAYCSTGSKEAPVRRTYAAGGSDYHSGSNHQ